MVTGLVIWSLVLLYGHRFCYMAIGLVIVLVIGLVIWLLVRLMYWLYGHWIVYMGNGFGYMVTGLVLLLPVWLYGYWFGYMDPGLVLWLLF